MSILKRSRRGLSAALALVATTSLSGCLSIMPAMAPGADDIEQGISADFPYESKYIEVHGSQMHYVEQGEGRPIVLLHGNPTSSYLWRNIIPHLSAHNRVIAVDLIGMGRSDKPALGYRFADHAHYFSGFMEAMALKDVTLVLHDWGGAIGLDYAARHATNIHSVALMEALVRPLTWAETSAGEEYLFKRLRDPEDGHEIISVDNYFLETMLPMMAGRDLSEVEMQRYQAPYPTIESRKPVAQWPREIPLDEHPADNHTRIGANYTWLKEAGEVPVLLLYADPGMIIKEEALQVLKREIPRLETAPIGSGIHYVQEVQPTLIGETIAKWLSARTSAYSSGNSMR